MSTWGCSPLYPPAKPKLRLVAPVPGVAVRFTVPSSGNGALHVLGQVMPGGELVTVPLPDTITVNTACVQTEVPMPAVVTNAVPNRTVLPSCRVAMTFPLPQSLMACTNPGVLSKLTRFCESMDQVTLAVMSLVAGGWL